VELNGHDVSHAPAHARARLGLARTFQSPLVPSSLTVRETLEAARIAWSPRLSAPDVAKARTLARLEAAPRREPSTVFLGPAVRQLDVLRDDIRALPSWRARLTLLKEHLFPGATYMRHGYAPGSSAPLVWLYLRRIVTGAPKWFRR